MWSRNFNFCLNCKTTDVKHQARGLCHNCYRKLPFRLEKDKLLARKRRGENPARESLNAMNYRLKDLDKYNERQKVYRQKKRDKRTPEKVKLYNILASVKNGREPINTKEAKNQIKILRTELLKLK